MKMIDRLGLLLPMREVFYEGRERSYKPSRAQEREREREVSLKILCLR